MAGISPRARAARIVQAWLQTGEYPTRALARVRHHHGFILEVVQGTVRWWRSLAFLRDELAAHPPRPAVDALLLTALYQLFFLDPGDEHAVVHETVEAAKRAGGTGAGRFCNGVLRNALRRRETLRGALDAQPPGVRYSHPDLLVDRWQSRFGTEGLRALCAWNNRPPEVAVRIRRAVVDPEAYVLRLCEAGLDVRPHPAEPETFVVLPRGVPVPTLPGYADGWFVVQDPATLAAPRLLDPRPGECVLDLCAAPGGKTALLAEAVGDEGRVVAYDIQPERRDRLRANLDRLRLSHVTVATPETGLGDDRFDRVLLDVPCSNTGVLRRRPDARWRFKPAALAELAALQRSLLDQAAARLLPGGHMVYSTCSLEPEENGERVRAWIADHPAWTLEAETEQTPLRHGTDGAYAARLTRTDDPGATSEYTEAHEHESPSRSLS